MHDDLRSTIDGLRPWIRRTLEDLVRIPSVSARGFDPGEVRRSGEVAAELLAASGAREVRLLEVEDAHPAVFGQLPGPADAPTVLLYAHHDVQPPGPSAEWDSPPFEAEEREGRLYGRGTADDKSGVVLHLAALRAFDGRPPVKVSVFLEGEEEIGSEHLDDFLTNYGELLAADVIVIADGQNWRVGQPGLTTSLRGLVDCVVEVRALEAGVHSGSYGGAFPDALSALSRILATLHDPSGQPAIAGLRASEADPLDLTEEELRSQAGALPHVDLLGDGSLTSRLWTKPAVSVLAIDAPQVDRAINQLVPTARAKVSVRLAPGDDPEDAMAALVEHLSQAAPWGVAVSVTPGALGSPFSLDTTGAAYEAFHQAYREAWGVESVDFGGGGSIPFVSAFSERYPEASILLTGVADPTSRAHGPNESLDLEELYRGTLAEAIALRLLAT